MIEHINEDQFKTKVENSDRLVLVDFFASWCGPCQMLSPVLEKIAEERKDFDIYKVDIDEETDLAISYGVNVVPTMIIIRKLLVLQ